MSRWWRAYDGAVDDPKLQTLPKADAWGWFNLMCLASANQGILPDVDYIAFKLRTTERKVETLLETLQKRRLIDKTELGLQPHNWATRQYQSDSSSERVKRHRAKREASGLQSQWTMPKKLRESVYERDGRKCVYCGGTEDLTVDHRTPEMRGGTHDIDNLQTACRKCNASKRDLTHDEFVSRCANETLLKRPQNTEQITETERKYAACAAPVYTDSRHELWGEGTAILGQLGVPEKSAKPNIGRWLRDAKDDAQTVLGAIQRARDNRVHDPIPWITRALRTPGTPNGKRPNGPHDTMLAGMAAALASRPDSRLFAGQDTGEFGTDAEPEAGNRGDHLRLAARRE